jgi:uncharacterized protein YecT (DUF1311 family)
MSIEKFAFGNSNPVLKTRHAMRPTRRNMNLGMGYRIPRRKRPHRDAQSIHDLIINRVADSRSAVSHSIKCRFLTIFTVVFLAASCKSDLESPAEIPKKDASSFQLEEKLSFEAREASSLFGPEYDTCVANNDGVTVAILQCIEVEYERQDAVLNIRYEKLMRQLPRAQARNLLQLQRGWIREKIMDCKADATAYGQSAVIQQSHCELNKTAIRAEQLRRMLDGDAGLTDYEWNDTHERAQVFLNTLENPGAAQNGYVRQPWR